MLEITLLFTFVAFALAALGGIGFVALLAVGVGVMLAAIFADWLRHKLLPAHSWADRRFGAQLRALAHHRVNLLLWAGLGSFLGCLGWLWAARLS
jgi:fatty acid desaturase